MSRRKLTLQHFIKIKGQAHLSRLLGVDAHTVYMWTRFLSTPRPLVAAKLIELSNGFLDWESIYQPYVDFKNGDQLSFDLDEE